MRRPSTAAEQAARFWRKVDIVSPRGTDQDTIAEQAARFWRKVDKGGGPDACWPWTGAVNKDGYGRVVFRCRQDQAHRVAFVLTNGEIPAGHVVRHKVCDNPPCCNPTHLLSGTRRDNARDAVEHQRQSFGERNGAAKLTAEQVFAIRVLFTAGASTRYELAARFGVSHRQICYIVGGERWSACATRSSP